MDISSPNIEPTILSFIPCTTNIGYVTVESIIVNQSLMKTKWFKTQFKTSAKQMFVLTR